MKIYSLSLKKSYIYITIILINIILWQFSKKNYLLFHSIVELFAIITAGAIFVIGVNSYKILKDKFLLKLGILYSMVAVIDILHTLSYKGMGVFPGATANLPTQLWILGRMVETIGLFLINIKKNIFKLFSVIIYASGIFGIMAIFFGVFPDAFIEGRGLTPFKIFSEYIIVFILLITIYLIGKQSIPQKVKKYYIYALIFTISAELSFTLYVDVYGFFNMLGHLFRFISYFILLDLTLDILNTFINDLREKKKNIFNGLIHNLKSPTTIIKLNTEMLLKKLKDVEEKKAYLENILTAVNQINTLIYDLLQYNSLCKNIKKEKIDYDKFMEIIHNYKIIAKNKNIDFIIEIEKNIEFYSYYNYIDLIISNLLNNAFKYTEKGHVFLAIKRTNSYLIIKVADTGIGINPEIKDKIFEPFIRGEKPGTGIGLTVVSFLIKKMDGDLQVYSKKGKGTIFEIKIPIKK
ncbi:MULTISPECIES: MASE3 domain-containing protein [unclassified Marinitoga]|uniref:MASE3 domain-containing protein n=1 Tax=unclassified Marinitoga TaxID=2640159 RepID=UPI00065A1ED8|nr:MULTISPECIES: MASE3 domain-containing protein [unclassified Marinitoga]KLO23874.1 diguanylate cyclase [Marinitoga sp. 1155]